VSKAVGGSVVRHAVTRKLRHLMAPRLGALPVGSQVVVRALPGASDASSTTLADDLDGALAAALSKGLRRADAASTGARP
jgi:ribonuclease P protein component